MDDNVISNDDEFNVDGILNVILKKNWKINSINKV
jgi:hypothetical protein